MEIFDVGREKLIHREPARLLRRCETGLCRIFINSCDVWGMRFHCEYTYVMAPGWAGQWRATAGPHIMVADRKWFVSALCDAPRLGILDRQVCRLRQLVFTTLMLLLIIGRSVWQGTELEFGDSISSSQSHPWRESGMYSAALHTYIQRNVHNCVLLG